MNDKVTILKKMRGWTLALAIWATVAGGFSLLGLLGLMLVELEVLYLIELVTWIAFYGVMAVIFYIYYSKIMKNNIVSQVPYVLWIILQFSNIVWLIILHFLDIRLINSGIIISVAYSSVMSLLAAIPLYHLSKCNKM